MFLRELHTKNYKRYEKEFCENLRNAFEKHLSHLNLLGLLKISNSCITVSNIIPVCPFL